MRTQDQGNNETISRGIFELHGRFTALTFSESKTFKTRLGAEKWLAKRGIKPDGNCKWLPSDPTLEQMAESSRLEMRAHYRKHPLPVTFED